ncbi:uncharacterized protein BDCG_16216 [Blastomyces dermatitidis ER-3]|uniref:Secreted peptide n=1 Tax=Ajellomyces dermatitidis (strain ER-3 / ATCC MYA-2586) TaxID=559297 RepID=A0ABX2VRM8_AJEDR|nr:uncharacterized protein BDCG_16216 [Blastomyces dermatitidis ER-3]OAS99594.1 hypothetical protein BDCG_16216 [Blastomyces dermatitidis ER-3]
MPLFFLHSPLPLLPSFVLFFLLSLLIVALLSLLKTFPLFTVPAAGLAPFIIAGTWKGDYNDTAQTHPTTSRADDMTSPAAIMMMIELMCHSAWNQATGLTACLRPT